QHLPQLPAHLDRVRTFTKSGYVDLLFGSEDVVPVVPPLQSLRRLDSLKFRQRPDFYCLHAAFRSTGRGNARLRIMFKAEMPASIDRLVEESVLLLERRERTDIVGHDPCIAQMRRRRKEVRNEHECALLVAHANDL